ncbi:MAG: hypothetical protein FWE71_01295 [Nocardioidaceae bacterium]|nr:hypothetical protein [Nocardioidaceae bacterium]MCL2613340.1 hypothetical protein [Nocardioidaceae bacterium]
MIGSVIGIQGGPNDRGETTVEWIGLDNRGVELEIGAVVVDGGETLLILHVMPTALRRK